MWEKSTQKILLAMMGCLWVARRGTGAKEYCPGTAWDNLLDDNKGVDLAGKSVAVSGCGDSQGYGDNFCDGIEELHETFAAAGAKMVGYVGNLGHEWGMGQYLERQIVDLHVRLPRQPTS